MSSDPLTLPGRPAMQQHGFYASTLRLLRREVLRLTALDPDPIAHFQAVLHRIGPLRVVWLPRGPVWADTISQEGKRAVLNGLRSCLPSSHLRIVVPGAAIDDRLLQEIGYHRLVLPQSNAWLDLTANAPTRLARQHGKWRNRLRHAQSTGLLVKSRPFRPDADAGLLQREHSQRRAKGYRGLPAGFTLAWATVNPGQVQLFEAHGRNGLTAFILILSHAPTATYHIGWTNAEGRACSAHNLLLWEASQWLAERQYIALDLGLVDHHRCPGLTRFKLGTGAEEHSGGATFAALPRLRLPHLRPRAA